MRPTVLSLVEKSLSASSCPHSVISAFPGAHSQSSASPTGLLRGSHGATCLHMQHSWSGWMLFQLCLQSIVVFKILPELNSSIPPNNYLIPTSYVLLKYSILKWVICLYISWSGLLLPLGFPALTTDRHSKAWWITDWMPSKSLHLESDTAIQKWMYEDKHKTEQNLGSYPRISIMLTATLPGSMCYIKHILLFVTGSLQAKRWLQKNVVKILEIKRDGGKRLSWVSVVPSKMGKIKTSFTSSNEQNSNEIFLQEIKKIW